MCMHEYHGERPKKKFDKLPVKYFPKASAKFFCVISLQD